MSSPIKVVVAMSGGVDSSVAAALLVEKGYEVIGMMMRLWSEPGKSDSNQCCTPNAMAMAQRVAAKIGIPFYTLDAREMFYNKVVRYFIQEYENGITPNPCLACNRFIRWNYFLQRALILGADFMATGHYARIRKSTDGKFQLLKAPDSNKDQSYVLHVLNQYQLEHTLFPVGEYTKTEVRKLARKFDLPTSERSDSQDLCFVGNEDYRDFLIRHSSKVLSPGAIVTVEGELLGQHQGLAFYTIGQRKGLGISYKEPLYVVTKDLAHNTLIVGTKEQLGQDWLLARDVNWISGEKLLNPFHANVKIRYKSREIKAIITPKENKSVRVDFEEHLRDITPGQAAVFYDQDVCLGGGIIEYYG